MRDEDPPLTPQLLLQAYRVGVFPMSESRDDPNVFWVDPRMRGIFPLNGFHVSRSLSKSLKKNHFLATANTAFIDVVSACADREETWINDTIFDLYRQLHNMGHAHSVEVWHDDKLVGGVYGVTLGAAFFGESMFSKKTDASKIALFFLIDRLNTQGFHLFDTQFITEHLSSLGAVEISRADYHQRLEDAVAKPAHFGPTGPMPSAQEALQRRAQTS